MSCITIIIKQLSNTPSMLPTNLFKYVLNSFHYATPNSWNYAAFCNVTYWLYSSARIRKKTLKPDFWIILFTNCHGERRKSGLGWVCKCHWGHSNRCCGLRHLFSHHLRICFKIASGKIPRYKAWPDVVREMESGRDWKLESDLRDGVIPT